VSFYAIVFVGRMRLFVDITHKTSKIRPIDSTPVSVKLGTDTIHFENSMSGACIQTRQL
jgi:hypothetical protein